MRPARKSSRTFAAPAEMPHPVGRPFGPESKLPAGPGGFADDNSCCPFSSCPPPWMPRKRLRCSRPRPRGTRVSPDWSANTICSTRKAGPAAAAICGRAAKAAERVYNAEWRKMITERYGSPPEISFFETPVIVDNTLGKTILDAAE